MALIKCDECGNQISDRASACPNCGAPIQLDKIYNDKEETIITSKISTIFIIFLCILCNMCGVYWSWFLSLGNIKGWHLAIPIIITVLISLWIIYVTTHTYITLTNKRIIGNISYLIKKIEIDYPIRQIKKVSSLSIFGLSRLTISTGHEVFRLPCATNCKQFKKKYFDLIENKYKYN